MKPIYATLFLILLTGFCGFGQISLRQQDTTYNRYADVLPWLKFVEYHSAIRHVTTMGESGPAEFNGNVLNIPNYTLVGLGGQTQLNGTGFVKVTGTTVAYDNSTYEVPLTFSTGLTRIGNTIVATGGGDLHKWGNPLSTQIALFVSNDSITGSSKLILENDTTLISSGGISTDSVGYATVYASSTNSLARRAVPVTFTEDASVTSISMYHNGSTGNVLFGVYSDATGSPDARLGVTAATAVSATEGWQTVDMISPVSVSNGQTVWLAFVYQNATYYRYEYGATNRAQSSATWSGGMPDPFGTSSLSGVSYSIYCNYETGSAPDTTEVAGNILITNTKLGIDVENPKAKLHISGGNDTVPPIIINPGALTTTPVNGALENDSITGHCYVTIAGERRRIDGIDLSVTFQTLTGTTPAWNIDNSQNAKITLTGNTTITLSNATNGYSGQLIVTNASTAYTLNVSGYTNTISRAIGTLGNTTKLNTSGILNAVDVFSWTYDGTYMHWKGELNVIK